jgi:hypothetical protein
MQESDCYKCVLAAWDCWSSFFKRMVCSLPQSASDCLRCHLLYVLMVKVWSTWDLKWEFALMGEKKEHCFVSRFPGFTYMSFWKGWSTKMKTLKSLEAVASDGSRGILIFSISVGQRKTKKTSYQMAGCRTFWTGSWQLHLSSSHWSSLHGRTNRRYGLWQFLCLMKVSCQYNLFIIS